MIDSDMIQTWSYRTLCAEFRLDYTTVEVLDFAAGTVTLTVRGRAGAERVFETHSRQIPTEATPEAAAEYRRMRGYRRLENAR